MKPREYLSGIYYGRYEKFVHIIISCLLFIIFTFLFHWIIALFVAFIFGIIKEIYDFVIQKERFDVFDISANIVGIFVGFVIYYIFINL